MFTRHGDGQSYTVWLRKAPEIKFSKSFNQIERSKAELKRVRLTLDVTTAKPYLL